jgi:hypothetical protein
MRLAVAGIAADFPDIDYLSFWIDPLVFLTDRHPSLTHSLLLMSLCMVYRPSLYTALYDSRLSLRPVPSSGAGLDALPFKAIYPQRTAKVIPCQCFVELNYTTFTRGL